MFGICDLEFSPQGAYLLNGFSFRLLNKLPGTISFYDLINYYRVEEAKRLLVDEKNQRSIIEIAFFVGFNSKSYFNQAFKKQTDMTPSQFRSRFLTQ